jgi:lysophospholipase L1-like esterase
VIRGFDLGTPRLRTTYDNGISKLKPHVRFFNRRESKNWVETNNLGFHDHDRDTVNENYRMLFIGDSFVEGLQVNTDSLFTARLGRRFSREGYRIECINAGLSGTGTAYQYALWTRFIADNLRVDHLVLCFYLGNDLEDNNLTLAFPADNHTFFVDGDGTLFEYAQSEGIPKKAFRFLCDYSALANTVYQSAYLLKRSMLMGKVPSGQRDQDRHAQVDDQENVSAWNAASAGTIALIRNWNSELKQNGIVMDVVLLGRATNVYNDFESDFATRLEASCADSGVGFLRLDPQGDPREVYFFNGKAFGHFNDRGHEMIADELYGFFKSTHGEIFKAQRH